MRFLLNTLLIAALAFLAGTVLPWWSIALVAFAVSAFLPQSLLLSFLSGFLGIFLLWGVLAAWIDFENQSLLSYKVAQVLKLGTSSWLLILVTAFVGALVGGFASMAGASLRPPRRRVVRA